MFAVVRKVRSMRIAHFAIISFAITFLLAYEQFRDPYEISKVENGRFVVSDKTTGELGAGSDEVTAEKRIEQMHKQLDDLRVSVQPMVPKATDSSQINLRNMLETWRYCHPVANLLPDFMHEHITSVSIADEVGMHAGVSAKDMSLISDVHTSFGDGGSNTPKF